MKQARFSYIDFAAKFGAGKLEASFISIELWDNKTMDYRYVGEIVFERHGYIGFVYDERYDGPPLDPAGLDYRKNGRVFVSSRNRGDLGKFFQNILPGAFGNRVLSSANRSWSDLSEAQRLAALCESHAQFDALNLNAHLGQHDRQVIGILELDKIVQQIVAYSAKELTDILNDDNEAALTALGGARGKTDYVHEDGRRYVAKPALRDDSWSVVRVEHAMGQMEKAAGIDSVKSTVLTLPSGNQVLMSLRYDQAGGKRVRPDDREFVMTRQYNRISMKAILTQDPDMKGRLLTECTYVDIANALKKYSDQPADDLDELYRRLLFHVGVNNTDNNLGNFEMYIDDKQQWRLAPSYDVLPDPAQQNEFVVSITNRYSKGSVISLDEAFIDQVAKELGIEAARARAIALPVMQTIANADQFLDQASVSPADCESIHTALRSAEARQLTDSLSAAVSNQHNEHSDELLSRYSPSSESKQPGLR